MIIEVKEFLRRTAKDLSTLVTELQAVTGRYGEEEANAWKESLPRLAKAFSSPGLSSLHLYFDGTGALSLEYQLPAASSWCDVVLLGRKKNKPGAVIIELKHWQPSVDIPGSGEGLIVRHGQPTLHPSDQVRGYAEYCRRFHSAVHDFDALVRGCVLFTIPGATHAYRKPPNDKLTADFPCFTVSEEDLAQPFPSFISDVICEPDLEFATAFETGTYKQDRGFVRQIGRQILDPLDSPFELLDNQRRAFALCRAQVNESLFGTESSQGKKVIVVEGPPGSGKSVVAAKLWAALATDERLPEGPIVFTSTSASQYSNWAHLFSESAAEVAGAGVVKKATSYTPITTAHHGQLKKKHGEPNLFEPQTPWRENLKTLKALGVPFRHGSRDGDYLVSVVDEAHALVNSEHKEGRANGYIPGLGPQAFHIIRVSHVSIFLLDPAQGFRTQENTTLADLKSWANELGAEYVEVSLAGSQFRCAGSKEYVDWVEALLRGDSVEKCRVLASAWYRPEPYPSAKLIPFPNPSLKVAEDEEGTGRFSSKVAEDEVPFKFTPKLADTKLPAAKKSPFRGSVPLEFRIFDDPAALETALRAKLEEKATARILASYARLWKTRNASVPHDLPPSMQDFNIPYSSGGKLAKWSRIWNFVPNKGADYTAYIQGRKGTKIQVDPLCEVGCPYAVRGFDWDYVGLLWFSDIVSRDGHWSVDPKEVHESGIKSLRKAALHETDKHGPHHINLKEAVVQAYRILLTRPIRGLYVWFEDEETRAHVESALG